MVTAQPAARARRSMMTLPSSRARSSSVATVFKKEVLGNALKGERRRERRTGKKTVTVRSEVESREAEKPNSDALGKILSKGSKLKKVMAANRGEIAVRVFRAGTELGMRTTAIFSEVDRLATHRYKADESYLVGEGKEPVAAYLDYESIIEVAKANQVDAIHPGYGLLSENENFARRCEEEGIIFIGPKSKTLGQMGDKVICKAQAKACGLPLVPGTEFATDDVTTAVEFAKEFGMPLMLKAAMGGGGRGMRVVRNMSDVAQAFTRASSEAKTAFGDGRMFIERYVEAPRHIEVQIIADGAGNVIHLGERDCSVQRRHQKVVESKPKNSSRAYSYGRSDWC